MFRNKINKIRNNDAYLALSLALFLTLGYIAGYYSAYNFIWDTAIDFVKDNMP